MVFLAGEIIAEVALLSQPAEGVTPSKYHMKITFRCQRQRG